MIGKMLGKILRDWPWKLLSLGAAVLIWAAVSSEPEMATILRVPVEYKDGPANLEISSDIASTVRLELTGNSGRLKDFSTTPSPVVLDFGNVRVPGERTFNIDASAVRLPQGVQLIRSVPAQLRFVFEPLETRSVPVQIQWLGSLAGGRQIAHVELVPPTLEVTGPLSRVSLVRSVSTDPVNLSNMVSGQTVATSPFIAEPQVRFRNFQAVHVTVILKN